LSQHKNQLEQTYKVIDNANANGWQRIVEMNTDVVNNLKKIISALEEKEDEK
jgi:hypothetical protein